MTISDQGRSNGAAPVDAVDVTAAEYGAMGDAVENYGTVTITNGTTIEITNFIGPATLSQTTPAAAMLTVAPERFRGHGFQPYDVGSHVFLAFENGYALRAEIGHFIDADNVILNASSIVPQTSAMVTATWPCFTDEHVGKLFVLDGAGADKVFLDNFTRAAWDTTVGHGSRCFATTIASVVSPATITLAAAPPHALNAAVAHTLWGTNDVYAVCAAGQAAFNSGKRKIYFRGDGRCFLLFGLGPGDAPWAHNYAPPAGVPASPTLNGCLWEGDNVRVYGWDGGGRRSARVCVPRSSDGRRSVARSIGRGSFRRCRKLTAINVLFIGDSQSAPAVSDAMAAWSQTQRFAEEFSRANPGKTINYYWMSVGGLTYASMASWVRNPTPTSWSVAVGWNVPRPFVGTPSGYQLMTNLNQTATGETNPIVPDLVCIFQNGGNDAGNMDGASMHHMINFLQNIPHQDDNGPVDILLQTDHQCLIGINTLGVDGGVLFPANTPYFEYSTGLIRSSAAARGLGCVDMAPIVMSAAYGWNPLQLAMRQVPGQSFAASETNPLVLPFECRDFSTYIILHEAADAALDIQVSSHRGNRIIFRFGANGHLWCGVSAYGDVTPTTCTIAEGSALLTVGSPATVSNTSWSMMRRYPNLHVASGPFSAAMAGRCLVAETGARKQDLTYHLQRNFIVGYLDESNVTLHSLPFAAADVMNQTGDISVGGAQFIPNDSYSQPDVVIFYADGMIFNSRIAYGGYGSATQAMLMDPAPQGLSQQSVPVFIGRMGVQWFDTGLEREAMGAGDILDVEVNRHTMTLLYQFAATNTAPLIHVAKKTIERFGGPFYPVIRPTRPQTITLSHTYIDDPDWTKVNPAGTPWELRGMGSASSSWYQGGAGSHPSSNLRVRVTDAVFDTNDLCTW